MAILQKWLANISCVSHTDEAEYGSMIAGWQAISLTIAHPSQLGRESTQCVNDSIPFGTLGNRVFTQS